MNKIDSFISLAIIDIIIAFNYIVFSHINKFNVLDQFLIYYISLSTILFLAKIIIEKFKKLYFAFYLIAFLIVKELFLIYFYIGITF